MSNSDNEDSNPFSSDEATSSDDTSTWSGVDSDSVAGAPGTFGNRTEPQFEADDSAEDDAYSEDYTDDSIDYDVDPDSLLDDDPDSGEDMLDEPLDDDEADQLWQHSDDNDVDVPWSGNEEPEPSQTKASWPIALIGVSALAVLLVIGGGWGMVQQRSDLQEEVRQLRGSLATAVSPEEASADREARRELKEQKEGLEAEIDFLQLENRQLSDTVQGLESQLSVQHEVAAQQVATTPPPSSEVAPAAPANTPTATRTTATIGSYWFVNFGSYGAQVTAENWATKLKPEEGNVVVSPTEKSGKTLFRVRIVDISSKEKAQEIALLFEQAHKTPKLWVGKHTN